MSYGLEPSQRDEWKSKHRVRFFFEERLVEVYDILSYAVGSVGYICGVVYREIINNKEDMFLFLLSAVMVAYMFV